MNTRGEILIKAKEIINGERQDQYGKPEDSFTLIAAYWNIYLKAKVESELKRRGIKGDYIADINAEDAAMMMVLFKIAREANQNKQDNIIDAAGYLGIYSDLQMRSHNVDGSNQL